jgi:predicted hydrolase (HD superfamily)
MKILDDLEYAQMKRDEERRELCTRSILDKEDVRSILENIDNLLLLLIHSEKMTWEEKEKISSILNEQVWSDSP